MNKKSKLKCRHCGSGDLYLEEHIITKSMISEDEGGTIIYENGEVYDDEIVEEFTCYRCDSCGRSLTIDNTHDVSVVVNEQNLEEYRQKYCSGS